MKCVDNKDISRREFLKLATVAVATPLVAACATGGGRKENDGESAVRGEVPTDKMTYRTNPRTGEKVSLLGYGSMRWPRLEDDSNKGHKGDIDQEAVNRLVDYAIAHGVNYFDTAPVYTGGKCEHATALALSSHPRDKYFIATKLSNFSNYTRENSIKMYERSFRELMVDYIDYYVLHSCGGGNGMPLLMDRFFNNDMVNFLVGEREKGKIRNLGFSFHGDIKVFDYLVSQHEKYHWDFAIIQLNYLDWRDNDDESLRNVDATYLYGELEKKGIPAVVMEPLLGGRLSKLPDHVFRRLKERRPLDGVPSWAFRFAGSFKNVLTVMSGMTYMEHLQDNIRTFSPLEPVTESDKEFLAGTADLIRTYPTIPCNECQYCMPCPYGIGIPSILVHYNKCVNEGNIPKSRQDENYVKARRAFLVGYDRSVPKLRQADHCIGCNKCEEHCPQKIRIADELNRIANFVEDLKQQKL